MIRLVVAACAWTTTAALGIATFWTLTIGGYLGELAEGNAAVDETMLATTYLALGFIIGITIAYATVGLLLATRTGGGRVGAVLLAGGLSFAAIPFGYLVGGFLIQVDPADPLANAVFLLGPGEHSHRVFDDPARHRARLPPRAAPVAALAMASRARCGAPPRKHRHPDPCSGRDRRE